MTTISKNEYKVEFNAWINMRHRCYSPKNAQYKDYGARGIKVHHSFLGPNGFWNFLAEVGKKPSPELTLDRIDNSKGYEPGNLRWVDRKTQQRNRRKYKSPIVDFGWGTLKTYKMSKNGTVQTAYSPLIPLGDETLSLIEWAKKLGLTTRILRQRFYRGLTPEQALIPCLFDTWGKPRNNPTIH